jgi:hypothetical protein
MTLAQRLSLAVFTLSLAAPAAAATKWAPDPTPAALVVAAAGHPADSSKRPQQHGSGPTAAVIVEPAAPTKLAARKPTSTDEARTLSAQEHEARGVEGRCSCPK